MSQGFQWVIVVRTTSDLNVETVGPFRSRRVAERALQRISDLEEKVQPFAEWAPSIERLVTVGELLADLKERFQPTEQDQQIRDGSET